MAEGMPLPVERAWSGRRNEALLNEGLSPFIQALLTDLYQVTMCYGYWKAGKAKDPAVFDLFFRKNPFNGEYTVFCGLEECLRFLQHFRYSESDLDYLRTVLPDTTEEAFFDYLASLDAAEITLTATPEGTVVFPKVPLMTLSGPLAVVQLMESTLLNLVNYASLVATNAARFRLAAGERCRLLEFGLRRAQGPNGGLCASKYCYIGGFDGTSNLLAGKLYGIPVKGTMAHSFVCSFTAEDDLQHRSLPPKSGGDPVDLYALSFKFREEIVLLLPSVVGAEVNEGELAAFVAYAIAFPTSFLALVDTYDVLKSGVVNFCGVALALDELGFRATGLRIDSGDLAWFSRECRALLSIVAAHFKRPWLADATIVASNDINEDTIYSLAEQGHSIDAFGVGTHLVTCQKQPALGCVFKAVLAEELTSRCVAFELVSVNSKPRMKLSQEVGKITLPGHKTAFRLYGKSGHAINDVLLLSDEAPPLPGQPLLCRHPFQENKRAYVTPSSVRALHVKYWADGKIQTALPTLSQVKAHVTASLATLRPDFKRSLNPTPYKAQLVIIPHISYISGDNAL